MRTTLKKVLAEYGAIAVVIYLALFFAVFIGSYFAIQLGWTPKSTAGSVGTWTAAYIVTKITQPLRIGATVLITTFLGKIRERRTQGAVTSGMGSDPAKQPAAAAEEA